MPKTIHFYMNHPVRYSIPFVIILLLNTCVLLAQRTYTYSYNSTGDRVYKLGDQQKSGSIDSYVIIHES